MQDGLAVRSTTDGSEWEHGLVDQRVGQWVGLEAVRGELHRDLGPESPFDDLVCGGLSICCGGEPEGPELALGLGQDVPAGPGGLLLRHNRDNALRQVVDV
ncbi:MAG: hypothetical protein ABIU87_04875, partial [Ornithinibacter sp.]